jgi:hypothetical protein
VFLGSLEKGDNSQIKKTPGKKKKKMGLNHSSRTKTFSIQTGCGRGGASLAGVVCACMLAYGKLHDGRAPALHKRLQTELRR